MRAHSSSVVVRGQLRSSRDSFRASGLVASIVTLIAISRALSDYFTEYLLNIK